jgi:hypothetical protein
MVFTSEPFDKRFSGSEIRLTSPTGRRRRVLERKRSLAVFRRVPDVL